MSERDARTTDLIAQLDAGIGALTSSDDWRGWLDAQAKFHRYSFGNVWLILHQRPDATRVASFNKWKELGRSVNKGERALWILAPMTVKIRERDDSTGEDRESMRVVGFKSVPVFDIGQTSGAELPAPIHQLTGACDADRISAMVRCAREFGFAVEFGAVDLGSANGVCSHAAKSIRVAANLEPAQEAKTLAHEIAHAILHGPTFEGGREVAEIEAESTAYVVGQILGIDSAEYTFGYVAHWAGADPEKARAQVRKSGARIAKTAEAISATLGAARDLAVAA